MKKLLIFISFLISVNSYSQYSNYYSLDVNQNIKQDVNVSGTVNVNKNISTIDYGQLAIANAQREKNRLESERYADEREKNIYLSVAENPLMAFDYGTPDVATFRNNGGFRRITISMTLPHKSLFTLDSKNSRLENISLDGITTEVFIYFPSFKKEAIDVEKLSMMEHMIVNKKNLNGAGDDSIYVLKKDIKRATVWGIKGYVGTLIWQDAYQNTITDNYNSVSPDGVYSFFKVRYYGARGEVTFEQLEGRRYYLRRLIEKVISSASFYDYKIAN